MKSSLEEHPTAPLHEFQYMAPTIVRDGQFRLFSSRARKRGFTFMLPIRTEKRSSG